MKKSVIILLVTLLGCLSQASAQPMLDTSRPARLLNLDVHVGDGVFTVRQNYARQLVNVTSFTLTPGNTFAIGAEALLNVRNFFGIGTGLDFAVNNYDFNATMLDDGQNGTMANLNTLYSDNRFYTIDIPIYMRFSFDLSHDRRIRWINEAGAYIRYGVGGRTDISTYRSSINPLGQLQVTYANYHNSYFDDDSGIINKICRSDAGFHLATGLTFNRFMIKGVFHAGLRNIARNFGVLDTKVHTMSMIFKAGYIF